MKRKAKDLGIDCDVSKNVNVMKNNIEEATDGKKKKIKFEKSLNKKPTGKSESVKNNNVSEIVIHKNKQEYLFR